MGAGGSGWPEDVRFVAGSENSGWANDLSESCEKPPSPPSPKGGKEPCGDAEQRQKKYVNFPGSGRGAGG